MTLHYTSIRPLNTLFFSLRDGIEYFSCAIGCPLISASTAAYFALYGLE